MILSSVAFSQKYGVHGGAGLNRLSGADVFYFNYPTFGFNAGAYAQYDYGYFNAFQFEANFIRKGGRMKDSIPMLTEGIFEITETFDYINLPVIYKIKYGNKSANLFLDWGAALSILVDSSRTFYAENGGYPITLTDFYTEEPKLLEISAIFGAGFRVKGWSMYFRYEASISNVYGGMGPLTMRNNVFSLNTAIQLHKVKPRRKIRHRR